MLKNKILIAPTSFSQFSSKPIEQLSKEGYDILLNDKKRKLKSKELNKMLDGVNGVIAGTEKYSKEVLLKNTNLKIISRLGVGLDNIDLDYAKEKKIKIFTTKTTPAISVGELVLGLIINLARNISNSNNRLKSGDWDKQMGSLLRGKTLGIIGLGTIGKELIQISKGFDFNILAFDKNKDNSFAKENNINYCGLDTLLKDSDIISIHLSLNEITNSLINMEKIKLMKSECIIINTSRGEIIDESALYEALKNNRLGGAGLDVFSKEPYNGKLIELDNVILTPHIGAYAKEIRIKMEKEAVNNLIRGLNE